MKLLFLLLPLFSQSQTLLDPPDPPKGTNTIIVQGVTFEQCVNTLLDFGYQIDKIDKDFKTVKTAFKHADNKKIQGYSISISVRVKDSTVTITSKTKDFTGVFADKNEEIEIFFKPSKMFQNRELFGEMDKYAKKLNAVVEYAKY